ncbi:MAG: VOC family protein [Rubrivivax sp.]
MNTQLDHLIVAAATLAQGVAWCEEVLGVTPGPGGQHPLMGTHNRLLKIATPRYPDAYFEIIAVDPQAAPPQRLRWFGLDEPAVRQRIAQGPYLLHAVARSTQLDAHRGGLLQMGLLPGAPVKAGRQTPQGPLAWQMLLRDDGQLLCGGALPTLIQWEGRHPAQAMPDSGVTLQSLTLRGVPERAAEWLGLQGVEVLPGPPTSAAPALTAVLQTPRGEVTLHSAAP